MLLLFVGVLFLGGLFSKTEMSEVLTEILKVDPSFDKDAFLKQCERDIIPNILEVRWAVNIESYLGDVNRGIVSEEGHILSMRLSRLTEKQDPQ